MDIDRIKKRISALLNLGADNSGATEAEAENALRFARRLMLEHNVTSDDVHTAAASAERVEYGRTSESTQGIKLTAWEWELATILADLVGTVKCYRSTRTLRRSAQGTVELDKSGCPTYGSTITFYGPAEDARDAAALLAEWSVTIAGLARLRFGGALRGPGAEYCGGFTYGLRERFEAIRIEERQLLVQGGSTALALRNSTTAMEVRRTAAKEWLLKSEGIKLRNGSGFSGYSHGNAFGAGASDGRRANLSRERTRKLKA